MRRVGAFVRLARPLFLFGGFAGFALGAAVARAEGVPLAPAAYVWGQALVTAFQLMVHFANDYYDRTTDVLATRTPWSGGSGVIAGGELPPRVALFAALACAAAGAGIALRAFVTGEPVLALLGAAIGILSWSYSAPPVRLLARGLGELVTLAVVAVLVPLAGYASFAHALDVHALAATVPSACAMFALMICVEIPDAGPDAVTGKRTLVVRWGSARALAAARGGAIAAVLLLVPVTIAIAGLPVAPLALGALIPAAAVAAGLTAIDRRRAAPAVIAGLGVALYATVTVGLLAAVASQPAGRIADGVAPVARMNVG